MLNGVNAGADTVDPTNNFLASAPSAIGTPYGNAAALVAMNAASITNVGGSQAHLNIQPFLTLTFGIALQGIFPSPN